MIEVNYFVVLGCAVVAMVLGALWYGPLFGRSWCKLEGVNPDDKEAVKDMQKGMGTTYLIQFLAVLFLVYVLWHYLKGAAEEMSFISNALWIWAGFIVPTLASTVLWTTQSNKDKRTRFMIQAGYNLVLLVVFAYIVQFFG